MCLLEGLSFKSDDHDCFLVVRGSALANQQCQTPYYKTFLAYIISGEYRLLSSANAGFKVLVIRRLNLRQEHFTMNGYARFH
jgi:hypothetical protein